MERTCRIRTDELLIFGAKRLAESGIEQPHLESQILLAHSASLTRLEILAYPERKASTEVADRFLNLIKYRSRRIPLAYLRGFQEFYGLTFEVNPSVLIPRPETELLVDFALLHSSAESVIWDVGTGSGCIAISCACQITTATVIASDVSKEALDVAFRNASRNGVESRISFLLSNLLASATPESVTLILSNPPYIELDEIDSIQPEVRDFEPRGALIPAIGATRMYAALATQAFSVLKSGGWLAVEVGKGQADTVVRSFECAGFRQTTCHEDLAGIARIVVGRKP